MKEQISIRKNWATFKVKSLIMKINIFKQININIWMLTENIQGLLFLWSVNNISHNWHIHTTVFNYNTRILNTKTSTKGQKVMALVYSCSGRVQLFVIKCGRKYGISPPQFLDKPLCLMDIYSMCPVLQNSICPDPICNINRS